MPGVHDDQGKCRDVERASDVAEVEACALLGDATEPLAGRGLRRQEQGLQALGAIAHRPSIDLENVAVKLPGAVRVEHEQQVSDQRAADHGPGARGLPRWRSRPRQVLLHVGFARDDASPRLTSASGRVRRAGEEHVLRLCVWKRSRTQDHGVRDRQGRQPQPMMCVHGHPVIQREGDACASVSLRDRHQTPVGDEDRCVVDGDALEGVSAARPAPLTVGNLVNPAGDDVHPYGLFEVAAGDHDLLEAHVIGVHGYVVALPDGVHLSAGDLVPVPEDRQLAVRGVGVQPGGVAAAGDVVGVLEVLETFERVVEDRGHVLDGVVGRLRADDALARVGLQQALVVAAVDGTGRVVHLHQAEHTRLDVLAEVAEHAPCVPLRLGQLRPGVVPHRPTAGAPG